MLITPAASAKGLRYTQFFNFGPYRFEHLGIRFRFDLPGLGPGTLPALGMLAFVALDTVLRGWREQGLAYVTAELGHRVRPEFVSWIA